MKNITLIILLGLALGGVFWSCEKDTLTSSKALYETHCSSCHMLPNINNIPKQIWEKNVLPEMAARVGIKYNNYNPFNKSFVENSLVKLSKIYPEQPTIDIAEWQKIHDYIIENAPDSLPPNASMATSFAEMNQFKPQLSSSDTNSNYGITSLQFSPSDNHFLIGDSRGRINEWKLSGSQKLSISSPVTSCLKLEDSYFVTGIGYMNPSQQTLGAIYKIGDARREKIAGSLHRPVYTEIVDLDDDNNDEIIICEFGNLTGQLSMLVSGEGVYSKRTLLSLPGFIKLEVADLNQDGRKDIIALAGQGREGIYVLYQKENLEFDVDHIIELGPEYGSSWFELFDYNKDGFQDIVLVNGDNADYSVCIKPYHGIRLYLNNGNNEFSEKWFLPINGATRVMARDFDFDGDFDFAVLAAFPDLAKEPARSFIYLENLDAGQYKFKPFVTSWAMEGRWLLMDGGDIDLDGDIDILLGAYYLPTTSDPNSTAESRLRNSNTNLLFLENLYAK